MYLSEDHRAVQDAVRAYVRDRIAPNAAAWDRNCHFPREELRGLAELGCYGIAVPTEWDGAGLDYLSDSLILEESAPAGGAPPTITSSPTCRVNTIMMAFASDEQKERFLKPLARGE